MLKIIIALTGAIFSLGLSGLFAYILILIKREESMYPESKEREDNE